MRKDEQIDVGQDAFLDVVANLVGILIILVVVIGAQATTAWQKPTGQNDHQVDMRRLEELVDKSTDEFNSLRIENHELKKKLAEEEAINQQLDAQRHQMLVRLEIQRAAIEERKSDLTEVQQASLIAAAQVHQLENKIVQAQYEAAAIDQNLAPIVQTIQHYPTPIARTVFSDEMHFRVKGGRVTYVPLDELVDSMKQSWRLNADRIRRTGNTSEVVGPIDDFRLQYETEAVLDPQTGKKHGVRMKRFVLQPIHEQIGEDIQTALTQRSLFRKRLDRLTPHKTTISLWVYPDGYNDLEKLQAALRATGFQTACWPLKYDGLISGGPQGFRTTTN